MQDLLGEIKVQLDVRAEDKQEEKRALTDHECDSAMAANESRKSFAETEKNERGL
jgi:hypothetical protein